MRGFLKGALAQGTVLGPSGQPVRDEQAHREFRRQARSQAERVIWEFPLLDGIEHRGVSLKDVIAHVSNDPGHPVSVEVARLMKAYVEAFRNDLVKLAQWAPKGKTPQMGITRRPPRWPVEHVAQHCAAVLIQERIIDATEEHELLNPDGDVGRVVSLPGRMPGV